MEILLIIYSISLLVLSVFTCSIHDSVLGICVFLELYLLHPNCLIFGIYLFIVFP